ncbi:MAG: hypothetical protein NTW87_14450 [Planctomycetota bacterium]|nr:hypothetical protein [Planctomycetota bacterium]
MSRHSPLVARRPFLAFIGGLILAFLALAEDVHPPSETPCEVIVSGRTSILKSIVIKKVGQNIPKIYHGEFTCKNAPGFDWYVSQHYALRANVGDKLAEQFLTLAELAYPQYVEVIGREPYDIETTRLPFVHATNLDLMQKVIVGDIGQPCIGPGGGVTMPHSCCAYNYPSGGLAYHRNDLSIHEGLHLQKFVTQGIGPMPQRFTEGTTHCFANHVYDPEKQQLTVCVFDKAPVNNPVDAGLRKMREKGILNIEDIIREKLAGEWYASAITLYTAFSWSDPERLMKWRIWRDELFRARVSGEALSTLDMDIMLKLHGGSLDGLNQQWQTWLKERQNTFTHVDWGWEQWGDTLQTYGWPWDKKYFSQMDINCVLNRKLAPDPLRLDYPRAPKSPLVGALALGVDEPSIGCVVDFKRAKDEGWAGLGLDVQGRNLLRVVVEKNKTLVLDGTLLKLQAGRKDVPFPPELLAEAKATGGAGFRIGRVGLTVRVAKAALEVTVRAGRPGRLPDEAEPFQAPATSLFSVATPGTRSSLTLTTSPRPRPTFPSLRLPTGGASRATRKPTGSTAPRGSWATRLRPPSSLFATRWSPPWTRTPRPSRRRSRHTRTSSPRSCRTSAPQLSRKRRRPWSN